MTRAHPAVLAALALTSGAACGGGAPPVPAGAQVGPALTAALAAADRVRAPWRCGAADGPRLADETLQVGARTWRLADHAIASEGKGDLVIGAIADAGNAAPATLAALGRLRAGLAKADVVLALGGMGTTQAELEATLGTLADRAPYPVIALPGDLESAGAQVAAIKALRAKGQVVIDGRLAHSLLLPGASIELVAGALAATRLVAGDDGCVLDTAALDARIAALVARPGIRILASAEAPRAMAHGEATGDLAITARERQEVDVALFGPTEQPVTRARTGGRNGDAEPVTPGTADATPRLPGPTRPATAGLLTISATGWTWRPLADAE